MTPKVQRNCTFLLKELPHEQAKTNVMLHQTHTLRQLQIEPQFSDYHCKNLLQIIV